MTAEQHRRRIRVLVAKLNGALDEAAADNCTPFISVTIGERERPYTHIGRVAVLPAEDTP